MFTKPNETSPPSNNKNDERRMSALPNVLLAQDLDIRDTKISLLQAALFDTQSRFEMHMRTCKQHHTEARHNERTIAKEKTAMLTDMLREKDAFVQRVLEEADKHLTEEKRRGDRLLKEIKRLKEEKELIKDWADGVVAGREHKSDEQVHELREKFRTASEKYAACN